MKQVEKLNKIWRDYLGREVLVQAVAGLVVDVDQGRNVTQVFAVVKYNMILLAFR